MRSQRTVTKLKADQLSPKLRERLGLDPGEEVRVTVERLGKKNNPWRAIKGGLTTIEAEALRRFITSTRRSRKAAPPV